VCAEELVEAALAEQAVAVRVDVDAVRGAGRLAVDEDPKRYRPSRSRREHEVRVAGVVAVGDAAAGLVEHGLLAPDRPLAGQGPVVETQLSGSW